jgi:adenylate cyclase
MRIYLQSILSSITSCVITLSDSMKLITINRPWFINALGISESFMKENPAEKWLGDQNKDLLRDIKQVYQSGEAIYVTDFEIKGSGTNVIVNYQVMPLIGSSGLVIVLDDISSEKRAVMTLGRYMSPALAKQVMEEGSDQLGGKRKKVSILFSDIRSFTTISEGMDPPEVVELLNHHFTNAVNAITEEQGILDKFIGMFNVM